jgi:hypothetical protein
MAATLGTFFHSASTVGGSISIRLRNIAIFQICSSCSVAAKLGSAFGLRGGGGRLGPGFVCLDGSEGASNPRLRFGGSRRGVAMAKPSEVV